MEEQISMKHKFVGNNYLRSCEEHKFTTNSSDCRQLFTLHKKICYHSVLNKKFRSL